MSLPNKSKKLFRSRENRVVAGICGGLAEYFGIDPTLTRILFIILAFAVGSSIWLYIILIFIMPLELKKEQTEKKKK